MESPQPDKHSESPASVGDGARSVAERVYHVPRRLSLASVLGGMTMFGVLFGAIQAIGGGIWLCLFMIGLIASVMIGQMWMVQIPRFSSAIMGTIFWLGWFVIFDLFQSKQMQHLDAGEITAMACFLVPMGAFLGYLTGGALAGFWLVADAVDRWWLAKRASQRRD